MNSCRNYTETMQYKSYTIRLTENIPFPVTQYLVRVIIDDLVDIPPVVFQVVQEPYRAFLPYFCQDRRQSHCLRLRRQRCVIFLLEFINRGYRKQVLYLIEWRL